jgi:hypothetical protein
MRKRNKCSWGDGISIRPDGVHELDPCIYRDIVIHKNVTVIVSKCQRCGNISISWKRQENTEDIYDNENELGKGT